MANTLVGNQALTAVGRLGRSCALLAITAVLVIGAGVTASAQGFGVPGADDFNAFDPFGDVGGLNDDNPIEVTASFEAAVGSNQGRLKVTASLAPSWHIYSTTQKKGGPTPTTITLADPAQVKLLGPFTPDVAPKQSTSDIWENLPIEEHEDTVTWSAPIEFADAANSKDAKIVVTLDGLTCKTDGSCVPLKDNYTATFSGTYEQPKPSGVYRSEGGVVEWRGELLPSAVAPGEKVELKLTAVPDEGFHVYHAAISDEANATNFAMTRLAGLQASAPTPSSEPVTEAKGGGTDPVSYHEGEVTWTITLDVPKDAEEGVYEIGGSIAYQACTDTSCRIPEALAFTGTVKVGSAMSDEPEPLAFEKAAVANVMEQAATIKWVKEAPKTAVNAASQKTSSLPVILGLALIGGLILNLMPCVLPVVGLKLMALVDSAGEDQRKVLSHNLWYSLGLLSVFWLLAAIAIAVQIRSGNAFSWGEQFTFWQFRFGLILLVFVMALSFLGVWEIPLPGFASGKASQQLQKKEGPAGAFSKGVFTTILATPCSGPFLGAVFGFTLAAPPGVTFVVFTAVGLGMAMPYILIGLMPSLVFWLPKPGPWMETLKQLMAFVLLGTVAFLFAGFSEDYRVFVFVALIGAWFGCWWIGQVPNWKPLHQRLTAWGGGVGSACLIGFLAFSYVIPGKPVMEWEPYSETRLTQLQAQGRTVMVDFTAKWCVNCIVNYNRALNTEPTAEMLDELDAVPMLADWTDRNEAIRNKLNELESNSIPVLAIYPGGRPGEVIILRDIVNQDEVIEALKQAGPSVTGNIAAK